MVSWSHAVDIEELTRGSACNCADTKHTNPMLQCVHKKSLAPSMLSIYLLCTVAFALMWTLFGGLESTLHGSFDLR